MKISIVAAAFAVVGTATPALAQQATDGVGPRIEIRAGIDHATVGVEDVSEGRTGFDYSLEAGYDMSLDQNMLLGVYAGIGDSTTRACAEVFGGDRACVSADRNITVGARVGARIGTKMIGFVKGGYSNGRASVRYTDSFDPTNDFDLGENADGFHVGGGLEFALRGRVFVKSEYVYTNYSVDTKSLRIDASLDRHQVLGGVGVRF